MICTIVSFLSQTHTHNILILSPSHSSPLPDGDGDGASDFLGSALAAVGVEPAGDPVSVLGLIRRIYKHAELFAPQCDRVLHHHTAAIVAIHLLESSKLLVAIDQKGCVCVWDPCAYRVSITVKHAWTGEIPGQPAFLGNHPYTIVQRIQLHDTTTGGTGGAAYSSHPHQTSKGKSHMCVTSMAHLGIPTILSTTFPCSRHDKSPTSPSSYAPLQYPSTASTPPSILTILSYPSILTNLPPSPSPHLLLSTKALSDPGLVSFKWVIRSFY